MSDVGDPIRIATEVPAGHASVVDNGDWDVTFRMYDKKQSTLFDITAMQGSPFVFVRSAVSTLTFIVSPGSTINAVTCNAACGSALLAQGEQNTYLIVSSQKNGFGFTVDRIKTFLPSTGGLLSIAVIAPGTQLSDYMPYALKPVTGTRASFTIASGAIRTTYQFPFASLIGVFPHQYAVLTREPSKLVGKYDTVRGTVRLYAASSFETSLARPSLLPAPPPVTVTDSKILSQLKSDIADNHAAPADDYGAGKDLLRSADLIEIADAMGQTALRTQALQKTSAVLADWCTATPNESGEHFVFDTRAGGLVAVPPSFGSEHYNDHHFHYGYFIHAAAIVTRFDATFPQKYGDCIRLMIRDIASFDRRDVSFPYLRVFDPYAGHSWAGGLTFFADGNNQESTSEALQAWYAIALYGRTIKDATLEQQGLWLWSQEAQGARTYWLNSVAGSGVFPQDFDYPMASIVWGGKIDYATFFDASDAAVRGIQFFPFSPALFPVIDAPTVSRLLTPLVSTGAETIWKTNARFFDALFTAGSLLSSAAPLDPVYSRSYLWYWQTVARTLGAPSASVAPCNGWLFSLKDKTTAVLYLQSGDPVSCDLSVGGKIMRKDHLNVGWNILAL